MSIEKLDAMALKAIKSYPVERPAMLGDLWSMVLLRRECSESGDMGRALQRLKVAGKIQYSRKPAGWVAA